MLHKFQINLSNSLKKIRILRYSLSNWIVYKFINNYNDFNDLTDNSRQIQQILNDNCDQSKNTTKMLILQ